MCGRFTLYADHDFLEEYFEIENMEEVKVTKRYNIAPSQPVFCLAKGKVKKTRAGYMRWGLVPSWASDLAIGNKMINARSETIHERRSFRPLWKRRHCAIIANSFYEWKQEGDGKQPYLIKNKGDEPLIFAGLWDRVIINGQVTVSCTMLTTQSNDFMAQLHHRMPVILNKESLEDWLQVDELTDELAQDIFKPIPSEQLYSYKVSKLVNSAKNEREDCIAPIETD